MWIGLLLFAGAVTAQKFGNQRGGIQSLKSVPLPPQGYVSPSALRQQNEPPKPFSYKYEGPDPYGGYSSHESTGDANGRITGQYTVQNPDGTSRLVKYVADPELGFHAEVETDEEGTKTSEPANASIISTAPEEGYQPQAKRTPSGSAKAPTPFGRNANRSAQNKKPIYGAARAPAPFAKNAYRSPQTTYRAPQQQATLGANRGSVRNPGLGRSRPYNPSLDNRYQQPSQQTRLGGSLRSPALNRPYTSPSANLNNYNRNALSNRAPQQNYRAPQQTYRAPQQPYRAPQQPYRAPQPTFRASQPTYRAPQPSYRAPQPAYRAAQPTYRNPSLNSNSLRPSTYTDRYDNQNRYTNRNNFSG